MVSDRLFPARSVAMTRRLTLAEGGAVNVTPKWSAPAALTCARCQVLPPFNTTSGSRGPDPAPRWLLSVAGFRRILRLQAFGGDVAVGHAAAAVGPGTFEGAQLTTATPSRNQH
jgi:hypothetical protein